jgi:IS5 family transposase
LQDFIAVNLKTLQNMKPRQSENQDSQAQLFKIPLKSFLNPSHPLVVLSHGIAWQYFDQEFGESFSDRGRPGLPTRLMAALTYLKHTYNLSDERLVEEFLENAYWQYFCGFEYFQHEFPCDSSSLTRWRKRLGEEGCQKLLNETLRLAYSARILPVKHLQEVIVDTTVQEKNITHPTDAKLLHRMRVQLVNAAKERKIKLRQSYERVSKLLLLKQSKYAHAKQYKRAQAATKKLRTLLGRVLRDILRQSSNRDEKLKALLSLASRLYWQKKSDSPKLYSLHEPAVDCISKGKSHKPYEFGCKTSIVTTARLNWVIGVQSFHGNPFDGHTLKEAIQDVEQNTGVTIQNIFADKGYRGSKHWPEGKTVLLSGRRRLKPTLKKLLKRRSAIEPVIGHMKQDHRLSRNLLKGILGDHINGILAGTAFNFRKILRFLTDLFDLIFESLTVDFYLLVRFTYLHRYTGGFSVKPNFSV